MRRRAIPQWLKLSSPWWSCTAVCRPSPRLAHSSCQRLERTNNWLPIICSPAYLGLHLGRESILEHSLTFGVVHLITLTDHANQTKKIDHLPLCSVLSSWALASPRSPSHTAYMEEKEISPFSGRCWGHLVIAPGSTPLVNLIQGTGLRSHWNTIAPTDLSFEWQQCLRRREEVAREGSASYLDAALWDQGGNKEEGRLLEFEAGPTEPTVWLGLPLSPPPACNVIPGGGRSGEKAREDQQANQGQTGQPFSSRPSFSLSSSL